MNNIKFIDEQKNIVEFIDICINANGHISFKLYVNNKFKNNRYILKSMINPNEIIKLIKLNLPFDYNQFFAMSQQYLN